MNKTNRQTGEGNAPRRFQIISRWPKWSKWRVVASYDDQNDAVKRITSLRQWNGGEFQMIEEWTLVSFPSLLQSAEDERRTGVASE